MLYDPEVLPYLCHFSKEQLRMAEKDSWATRHSFIRIFLICICMPLIPSWCIFYDPWSYHSHFTNWALFILLASLIVSFLMPFDLNYKLKPQKMALNHLLMTLSITIHMPLVLIFWTAYWNDVSRKARGFPGREEY